MSNENPLESAVAQSSVCGAVKDPVQESIETVSALFDPDWLDFNALIIDVIAQLLPMVLHHKLRWHLARVLPLLWGDHSKLAQVFFCLIGNAIRYAPAGSEINVMTAVEGRVVHASVCDQGASSTIRELEHLLQYYSRNHAVDQPQDRMLDSGLPLVYAIIRIHGGRAWIESGQRQGFAFHFTLPFPVI
jgi:signal transduction histidine kinase